MQLSGQTSSVDSDGPLIGVERFPLMDEDCGMIQPDGASAIVTGVMCERAMDSSNARWERTSTAKSASSTITPQSRFPLEPGAGWEEDFQFPEPIQTLSLSFTATLL